MNQHKSNDAVNLFWTGGWDSTFQLLHFLLVNQRPVQPYYILDDERQSTGIEIYCRSKILQSINHNYPKAFPLIYPTIYINKELIENDQTISSSWNKIYLDHHIGTQYDWLPRFCKQNCITNMQIGLFKSDKLEAPSKFYNYHMKYFALRNENQENFITHHLMKEYHTLFRYFEGSLLQTTKQEMYQFAHHNNWLDTLNLTNFCYRPSVKIKACGICSPCTQAIDNSMGWRIPFSGVMNRWLYKCKTTIKHDILKL